MTPGQRLDIVFAGFPSKACSDLRTNSIGAYEHGAGRFRCAILHKNTEPARDFLIGLDQAAHIAAETIFVQLILGLNIPETAAIRADLVGQHDSQHVVLEQPAEFDLEVDKADADA